MKDFILKDEFIKWLLKNGVAKNSIQSYCPGDIYDGKLFLDIIGEKAKAGDLLGASAILGKWKDDIYNREIAPKTRSNRLDYHLKYSTFVFEYIKSKKKNIQSNEEKPFYDGMDSLISFLGVECFIKMAIQGSYIFSKDLVNERLQQICNYITDSNSNEDEGFSFLKKGNQYLPARYSAHEDENDVQIQKDDGAYFKIADNFKIKNYQEGYRNSNPSTRNLYGGGNGNARVCQLINNLTGYNLGLPADKKPFRNFIISHIWGNAVDPRYFTNLWNIAIVPSWANHLLDKDETGTLAAIFKDRLKAVIGCYYDFKNKDSWDKMRMSCPDYDTSLIPEDIESYQINIISKKNDDQPYGEIKIEEIKFK